MARTKRLLLAFALALGLAATAANYLPLEAGAAGHQIAGSKGEKADSDRESSYQTSFIDDDEIIEQVAGSKGDMARGGRESS